MRNYPIACECGAPVAIKLTGECRRCYSRRWAQEHFVPKPPRSKPGESTAPCSYGTAHMRVKQGRGRAAEYACIDCGEPALEWSYRGGSDLEQAGYRRQSNKGRDLKVWTTWSPRVWDYDPMCRTCHLLRDKPEDAA